jgi:cytochrome P450
LEAFVDASSDDETTTKIVDAINVQWVTSTLSVPIVCCHAIQDLYLHPDFAEPLKIEANSRPLAEAKFDEMPVLEAFIMESLRSHCFQSTTCHRMTVDQFRFSDGYTIPPGEMVKFHSHRMLLDENLYPDSRSFNPNRFSNTGKSLVDTGMEWPFWGVPKMIW